MTDGGLGPSSTVSSASLIRSLSQPYSGILWSDASGEAMGGYILGPGLETGVWGWFDFDQEVWS